METIQEHSKVKLALGVITSPSVAFEEILRRKLLGEAFVIAAAAGTLAMIATLLRDHGQGPIHLFTLGYANPITWVGLMMLYGLAVHLLLKWLGTETDYRDVLTVMGWAQVTLGLSRLFGAAEAGFKLAQGEGGFALRALAPAAFIFDLWYLAAVGIGIRSASTANLTRGVLSYLIIHLAATIGFTLTYGRSRLDLFNGASTGIYYAAQTVVSADKTPWLAGGFAGIALGLWFLGKSLGWDDASRKRLAIIAAAVGAAIFGSYYYALWKTDYYGQLLHAQALYERDKYTEAAGALEKLLARMPGEAALLSLDIGDFSFAGADDSKAFDYYNKTLKAAPPAISSDRKLQDAHARVGLGMVSDIRGEYKAALTEFQKAGKLWPEFREPWSRSAVTYARMGEHDKAIEAANHAVKKLGSEAPQAYIALVQSYAAKGQSKQAEATYDKLWKLDRSLAKKIGKDLDGWKNAVSKLTRHDMVFSLEKQIAQQPQRPSPKKAPRVRRSEGASGREASPDVYCQGI